MQRIRAIKKIIKFHSDFNRDFIFSRNLEWYIIGGIQPDFPYRIIGITETADMISDHLGGLIGNRRIPFDFKTQIAAVPGPEHAFYGIQVPGLRSAVLIYGIYAKLKLNSTIGACGGRKFYCCTGGIRKINQMISR